MGEPARRIDLRLPASLYTLLTQAASEDTRSLNTEVIALLKEAVKRRKERHERHNHRLDR